MRRVLPFLIPIALFAVLVVFLGVGLHLDPREVPSPLIGKSAPDFALVRLDEPAVTIRRADMLGKVWMLNVWSSWCMPCREEHPVLVEFAKNHPVPIYGLNYKDKPDDAKAWLVEGGNPYDVSLVDRDGRVGINYGVYGVPETFIIDKRGVIQDKVIGVLTPEILQGRVMPLLRKLNG